MRGLFPAPRGSLFSRMKDTAAESEAELEQLKTNNWFEIDNGEGK